MKNIYAFIVLSLVSAMLLASEGSSTNTKLDLIKTRKHFFDFLKSEEFAVQCSNETYTIFAEILQRRAPWDAWHKQWVEEKFFDHARWIANMMYFAADQRHPDFWKYQSNVLKHLLKKYKEAHPERTDRCSNIKRELNALDGSIDHVQTQNKRLKVQKEKDTNA